MKFGFLREFPKQINWMFFTHFCRSCKDYALLHFWGKRKEGKMLTWTKKKIPHWESRIDVQVALWPVKSFTSCNDNFPPSFGKLITFNSIENWFNSFTFKKVSTQYWLICLNWNLKTGQSTPVFFDTNKNKKVFEYIVGYKIVDNATGCQ